VFFYVFTILVNKDDKKCTDRAKTYWSMTKRQKPFSVLFRRLKDVYIYGAVRGVKDRSPFDIKIANFS